ncbi:L-iditol 2-dehydrogenase [Penicillium cataractarum]|uniref:D-xylulose reductase n=1 Tax=Penicillium cataractarum TaxID=2100454 RepID=A0A9W9SJQ7_9EURO|nr:L-iditol 2-dehydrogenase [Penicillium cataractarum]KAJ5379846.1 L-iditol 2-dehydrogenase [Penicillium cataractarum]
MNNPAVVVIGPGKSKIIDTPIPKITGENEAIIRIKFGGVCGSDVHFWDDGAIDGNPVSEKNYLPLGHEASGTIVSLSPEVKNLSVGDNVAIEPANPCRVCIRCREGVYNLCPNMKYAASGTEHPGTLTKFFKVPADFCYKLPPHVSLEEGVLAEPLAVAAHSVRMIGIKPGQSLVIFGAGTIGLVCGAVAKVFGARKIVLVDILDSKLGFAKGFLDCETFKTTKGADPEAMAAEIIEKFNLSLGADAVIEATGAASSTMACVFVARKGAHFVQTGIGKHIIDYPIFQFSIKELHMHGAFRHSEGDYRVAMDILENRLVPVKQLITRMYNFEDIESAWTATLSGKGVKNMVRGVPE